MKMMILSVALGLLAILLVCSEISLVWADKVDVADGREDLQIQYLKRLDLNISSGGVNRLNFGDTRIVKIVGDSSLYGLILSDNGSDLFLTSKIAAPSMIDLTLIAANNEAIDIRLHVGDRGEGSIINVDINGKHYNPHNEKEEISEMINKMQKRVKGKYFVEEKKRLVNLNLSARGDNDLVLNQYVSYRFGDLMGAGFNYSVNGIENNGEGFDLTKDRLQSIFKNILAVAVDRGKVKTKGKSKVESGRIFVVFKAGEELDV